jgi:hypothetical protein
VSCVELDPYIAALGDSEWAPFGIFGRRWMGEAVQSAVRLLIECGWDYVRALSSPPTRNVQLLRGEFELARLIELVRRRSEYDRSIDSLRTSSWMSSNHLAPVKQIPRANA